MKTIMVKAYMDYGGEKHTQRLSALAGSGIKGFPFGIAEDPGSLSHKWPYLLH